MNVNELLSAARAAGFDAAVIGTGEIVFDPGFRVYCAENRCGQYGANWSCPPDCGEFETMREALLAFDHALVVHTVWSIDGYQDYEAIRAVKRRHNQAMLDLCARLRSGGTACRMGGASHCTLCEPCARTLGEPCRDEENRFSCLSAYCIHVAKLAEAAGIDFFWSEQKMNLYGLIAF